MKNKAYKEYQRYYHRKPKNYILCGYIPLLNKKGELFISNDKKIIIKNRILNFIKNKNWWIMYSLIIWLLTSFSLICFQLAGVII